jgi:NitT/TauT family transport system permease protein
MHAAVTRKGGPEGGVREGAASRLLPFAGLAALVLAWDLGVRVSSVPLLPGPLDVLAGLAELAGDGVLVRHVVASLFRVTWGYLLAVALAIPIGLHLGTHPVLDALASPLVQVVRPISPIAWIPIAILWFGVGDLPAVWVIFLGAFLPLVTAVVHAVRQVDDVHVNAGRNFGLTPSELRWRVVFPAALPQILVAMRLSLGIAWLVVVAAEMVAVSSGLGFLILDSRNAGDRYDLVMAGMLMIGLIGVALDAVMKRLHRAELVRRGLVPDEAAT